MVWLPVVGEAKEEVVMDQEEAQELALSSVQVDKEDKIQVLMIMVHLAQVVQVEDQMEMVMLQAEEVLVKLDLSETQIMVGL